MPERVCCRDIQYDAAGALHYLHVCGNTGLRIERYIEQAAAPHVL